FSLGGSWMTNKLVLIDGNSIIYRAFFALPLLNNDKGIYTNAVYGFTTMLMRILEEEKPTHMLVALDAGKTTFRHEQYKEYKGGRQKTPPELSEQFPVLKELLNAFSIPHYQIENYEADDIIGTLATQGQERNWDVTIISGDKDLLQLVSDSVTVNLTKKGISEVEQFTPTHMEETMNISPHQIIDMKALMGDNSDNIPGVPGIGQKTAIKLLKQYKTLEEIYVNVNNISGKKLKENLITYKDNAKMSKELVTIKCDSPVEVTLEDLPYKGFAKNKVTSIFKDLGFQSLLSRLDHQQSDNEEDHHEFKTLDFTIVDHITKYLFTGEEALYVEMLTDNYHHAPIEGIGIVNEIISIFIPTDVALKSNIFKQWAEDKSMTKYVFDAKKTVVALLNKDIHLRGISFDMLLASYLLNPSENHHDIPAVGQRYGKKEVLFDEEVYGKGAKMKVPEQSVLAEHIVRKTAILYSLIDEMNKQLKANKQYMLFKELEMPLALILGKMEHYGIKVDVARLQE